MLISINKFISSPEINKNVFKSKGRKAVTSAVIIAFFASSWLGFENTASKIVIPQMFIDPKKARISNFMDAADQIK